MKTLLLLCSLFVLSAQAAETGTALKADTLREKPFADAKNSGNLNKGDSVEILTKQGAWLQVKSKKSTGWVRLLSVKRGTLSNGNPLQGASDVASGRTGTGNIVSTTGVRGLSAEELKAAQFNEEEMKKMESYTTNASDAQQYAAEGGLTKTNVAYLKGVK